jgi:hypothetical protein
MDVDEKEGSDFVGASSFFVENGVNAAVASIIWGSSFFIVRMLCDGCALFV